LRRPLELGRYTSIRYTDRLDQLGAAPSVGSRGDAYDDAMAEAWIATFKSETRRRTPPPILRARRTRGLALDRLLQR
jgi:putative transposase